VTVDLDTNEALKHADGSEAVLITEERKETEEESIWPADFAQDEKDDLDKDNEAVGDRPNGPCRSEWNGRAIDVIGISDGWWGCRVVGECGVRASRGVQASRGWGV